MMRSAMAAILLLTSCASTHTAASAPPPPRRSFCDRIDASDMKSIGEKNSNIVMFGVALVLISSAGIYRGIRKYT